MTQKDFNALNRITCKRFEIGIDEHVKESKGKQILLWSVLVFSAIVIIAMIYGFIEAVVWDATYRPWNH
ncbi:MAG TPA: hypothetical protein VEV15_13090 [Flavisolibacter sp.]|nr:hypothetical protein [Flavisolibacter sp.]